MHEWQIRLFEFGRNCLEPERSLNFCYNRVDLNARMPASPSVTRRLKEHLFVLIQQLSKLSKAKTG